MNREFSWLQFNRRVLEETLNPAHPLLERLRFLSISAANLDEFFMVRVAGLEGQVRQSISMKTPDGKTPAEQLEEILKEIDNLQMEQQASLAVLQQYLAKEDMYIVRPPALSDEDRAWLENEFEERIFAVLTPLSIDPAHPFPFIPNLGFSMGLQLESVNGREPMTALLRLPTALDRFIRLPETRRRSVTSRLKMWWASSSTGSIRATPSRASAHSASSATAISSWKKRPKIWFATSKAR